MIPAICTGCRWRESRPGGASNAVSARRSTGGQEPGGGDPSGGEFGANINVAVQPTSADLMSVVQQTQQQNSQLFQDYEAKSGKELQLSGRSAYLMSATFTQGQFELRNLQLLLVDQGSIYAVTGTALQENWGEYEDQLHSALMSFGIQ